MSSGAVDGMFAPPDRPPPLLTDDEVIQLAQQGHLQISLPSSLAESYSRLAEVAGSEFFSQSVANKKGLYPAFKNGEVGYVNLPKEKEYVTFRCSKHTDSGIEKVLQEAWRGTAQLLYRILIDLTRPFDSHAFWKPLVESSLEIPTTFDDNTLSFVRLFQYLPDSGAADSHTDSGLLTLCMGQGQGLQVWSPTQGSKEGEQSKWAWEDAQGPTILIGVTLRRLLANRVRSGLHRVVSNPEGRSSAVFALRPNIAQKINLGGDGDDYRIDMKNLWAEIIGKKYSVNAPKQVRDEQQQRLREQRNSNGEGRPTYDLC